MFSEADLDWLMSNDIAPISEAEWRRFIDTYQSAARACAAALNTFADAFRPVLRTLTPIVDQAIADGVDEFCESVTLLDPAAPTYLGTPETPIPPEAAGG